MSNYFWSY